MKNLILTLILILTTSLVSVSQLTYTIIGSSDVYTLNNTSDTTLMLGTQIKILSIDNISVSDLTFNLLSTPSNSTYTSFVSNDTISFNSLLQTDTYYFIKAYVNSTFKYFYFNIIDTTSTASINDKEIEITELIAYPNPTVGDIHLAFNTNNTKTPIYIFALNGQLVYQDNESRMIGTNRLELNTSNFASGLYIIKVANETFKFVKIKQ